MSTQQPQTPTTQVPISESEPTAGSPDRPDRTGLPYFHTLRPIRGRGWRSALGVVVVIFGYLILSGLFSMIAMTVDMVTGTGNDWRSGAFGQMRLTPSLLLAATVAPALMIPLVAIFERIIYGRSGLLHSVAGRLRRRWLAICAAVLVPLIGVYMVVFSLLMPQPGGPGPAAAWPVMLAITLLLVPLQSAGEEYAVRGFLARIVGSWFSSAKVALAAGIVLPSLIFMVAHGASDPWLWVYYFTFGATMGLVAWQTGGLEAPILLHAVNNVVAFTMTIILTDTAGALDRSAGVGGPFMLIQIAALALFGLLVIAIGRRRGIATRVGQHLEQSAS